MVRIAAIIILILFLFIVINNSCDNEDGEVIQFDKSITSGTTSNETTKAEKTYGMQETKGNNVTRAPDPTFILGEDEEILWSIDWDDASSRAQAENKPIMINFYTNSCPFCVKLDKNTFTDPELINFLNRNYISLKSNNSANNLYKNYKMQGVPTTIVTEPDGKEIGRIIGYYEANEFLSGLRKGLDFWNDQLSDK